MLNSPGRDRPGDATADSRNSGATTALGLQHLYPPTIDGNARPYRLH